MKFDIILEHPLKTTIEIKKLGMTIRPLSEKEKENYINKMDELYFSAKAKSRINTYNRLEKEKNQNPAKYLKFFDSLTEPQKAANFMYNKSLENGTQYLKNDAKNILNNSAIVELDDTIDEFIDKEQKQYFCVLVLKFLLYINFNIHLNELQEYLITSEKFSLNNDEEIVALSARIFNSFENGTDNILTPLKLNDIEFFAFQKFIELLPKERIRDFVIIIETLFNNNIIENKIVSMVSIVERMILKHDNNYDIGKQFVLKFGLILRDSDIGFEKEFTPLLTFCYAVRSCIVHGDDKKILDLPKKYLKVDEEYLNQLLEANTHYTRRARVLTLCCAFLQNNLIFLLKQWVYDTNKIEFLKDN